MIQPGEDEGTVRLGLTVRSDELLAATIAMLDRDVELIERDPDNTAEDYADRLLLRVARQALRNARQRYYMAPEPEPDPTLRVIREEVVKR